MYRRIGSWVGSASTILWCDGRLVLWKSDPSCLQIFEPHSGSTLARLQVPDNFDCFAFCDSSQTLVLAHNKKLAIFSTEHGEKEHALSNEETSFSAYMERMRQERDQEQFEFVEWMQTSFVPTQLDARFNPTWLQLPDEIAATAWEIVNSYVDSYYTIACDSNFPYVQYEYVQQMYANFRALRKFCKENKAFSNVSFDDINFIIEVLEQRI
jgi:hypothetical protein